MILEIHSKSKGNFVYKNVRGISTGARYVEHVPIFHMTIYQENKYNNIQIDDITSFEIYESLMTWIDDRTDIVCPYCSQHFDSVILEMAHGDKIMQHCPKCGKRVDIDGYLDV